ncbi:metal-dependent phosphohydrolase [Caminicella sporogenes]|nr:metal-dependent phosphohydrolase [Caminicella sporogenes]
MNEAIKVAAKAHDGHRRKASDIPYIVHPFEVALILQKNGASDEVIAAGILHDTLEDTDLTEDDIKNIFGEKILNLVLRASEELYNRENRPWEDRKKHTIDYSKKAPLEVKLLICADKLSNIRSMIKDYKKMGEKLWDKFNAPYDKQKWYYKSLVKSLKELDGYEMYEEFKEAVEELFG